MVKRTLKSPLNTRWDVGKQRDHIGIIPRCDLNFEDEISFKEGRVVTPAFFGNARVDVRDCPVNLTAMK
jgi:hypothetical protein